LEKGQRHGQGLTFRGMHSKGKWRALRIQPQFIVFMNKIGPQSGPMDI
jgi:hypothetical protein